MGEEDGRELSRNGSYNRRLWRFPVIRANLQILGDRPVDVDPRSVGVWRSPQRSTEPSTRELGYARITDLRPMYVHTARAVPGYAAICRRLKSPD